MKKYLKISDKINKKVLYGLFAILWMGVIFFYSAQNGDSSGNTSNDITHFILNALTRIGIISDGDYTPQDIMQTEGAIRSIAHFTEYLILGLITYKYVLYTIRKKSYEKILYPFIFCGLYALTDETHQYFVPGRAMQLSDWLIDAAGALTGIIIFFLLSEKLRIYKIFLRYSK